MANKLTPKQQKLIIQRLNKKAEDELKSTKWENKDFYPKGDELPFDPEEAKKVLNPAQQELFDKAKELLAGNFNKFFSKFCAYPNLSKKPEKDAFVSVPSPSTTKRETVNFWDWGWSDLKLSPEVEKEMEALGDSNDILKSLSAADRNALLKKLDFKAEWGNYDDGSGHALFLEVPLKPSYLNFKFKTEDFEKQVKSLLARQGLEVNHEDLVEKLAEFFIPIGQNIMDAADDEDNFSGDEESYAADEVRAKKLSDIIRGLDDSDIVEYIEKLKAIGVDDAKIIETLVDTAEGEFSSGYSRNQNTLGSGYLNSEDQLDDNYFEQEFDLKDVPFPEDLSANIALLSDEDVKSLQREVHTMHLDLGVDSGTGDYVLRDGTVYLGEDRRIDLVAQAQPFISKAKRFIKDHKLEKRGTKLKRNVETSMKYPTLEKIHADANDLALKQENLPPLAKREMIAQLYQAIAQNVLPMSEDRIEWMVGFIHNNMTDNEVNKEWDFIRKGNVQKLVKLFKQMEDPNVQEQHADKIADMALLHEQLSEGIMKTKEAGGEVDPETFDALEKIVMDFADDFVEEMKGAKALPGAPKNKQLASYPALSKVLSKVSD